MSHPYDSLPEDRFWRTAVAGRDALEIAGLWKPRHQIGRRTGIVTAGSCFAQHFARALAVRRYRWLDFEPGPAGLTPEQRKDYHYGTFSFRTGNIYTPRMLRQWLTWALTDTPVPGEVWEKDGRFYDPFRPGVEPGGFVSAEELYASRKETLAAIAAAVRGANVFVFTLGLTEAWQDKATGVEYAVCPGTVAGRFDAEAHGFVNHGFGALMADMTAALRLMVRANRRLVMLLTVSPVPLTATASGQHVLAATSHSKSLLRAVASEMVAAHRRVDYFPSYEIINAPTFRGMFFEPDQRSVNPIGVDFVMNSFFEARERKFGKDPNAAVQEPKGVQEPKAMQEPRRAASAKGTKAQVTCDEEVLAAFGPRS